MTEKITQERLNSSSMFPMMEQFEESGMTQKQFCSEMDLVPHTFTYWLSKYRKSHTTNVTKKKKPKFVELAISSSQDPHRLMRITYPDGTLIELPVS